MNADERERPNETQEQPPIVTTSSFLSGRQADASTSTLRPDGEIPFNVSDVLVVGLLGMALHSSL